MLLASYFSRLKDGIWRRRLTILRLPFICTGTGNKPLMCRTLSNQEKVTIFKIQQYFVQKSANSSREFNTSILHVHLLVRQPVRSFDLSYFACSEHSAFCHSSRLDNTINYFNG